MSIWSILEPQTSEITNLITNPSFETGTAGWTAGGSNTLAQSSVQQWRGGYSCLCTYQDNVDLSYIALSGLGAGQTYYARARIWVPANWDGGNIRLDWNFTDDSETFTQVWTAGTDPTGEWYELISETTLGSDVAANLRLHLTSSPTAGRTVYLDSVYFGLAEVNYFDGDTAGCRWTGTRHGSTSVSARWNPQVGVETALTAYGFYPSNVLGIGRETKTVGFQERVTLPGALAVNKRERSREVQLIGNFQGSSLANLHSKRKSLLTIIDADRGTDNFVLRYTGAETNQKIDLLTTLAQEPLSSLANETVHGYVQRTALMLRAFDPYWYGEGGGGGVLDGYSALSNVNQMIRRDKDGVWSNMDQGANNTVQAMAVHPNGQLVVVGSFTQVGSGPTSTSRVALYDPSTDSWTGLTGGPDASNVYAIAIEPGTGDIYVGGDFTTLNSGGTTANRVAYYDMSGSSWQVLTDSGTNTGVDGIVRALAFDNLGNLYLAGQFANAGGTAAAAIAYWDGTDFNALGTGLTGGTGIARALLVDHLGRVWVGGDFNDFDGTTVANVAYWTATAETPAAVDPGGGTTTEVYFINQSTGDRTIYIGGESDFAYYTGKTWEGLGKIEYTGGTASLRAATQVSNIATEKTPGLTTGLSGYYLVGIFDRITLPGDKDYRDIPDPVINLNSLRNETLLPFVVDLPGTPTVTTIAFNNKSQDLFLGFSTNGTANTPNSETLTNNGTARGYPLIELRGPTSGAPDTLYSLINNTTGKAIYFDDFRLYAGSTVLLDLRPGSRAFYYPGNQEEKGVNLWQFILPGSDLDWFLAPGDNYIDFNTADNTMTAVLSWREAHLSIDGVAD